MEEKRLRVAADQRHRIRDDEQPARPALGVEGDRQCARVDMVAVGDVPGPDVRARKGGADEPGLAMAKPAHRIEEMGHAAGAGVEERVRLVGGAVGVTQRDDDAGGNQPAHRLRRCLAWRKRDHQQTEPSPRLCIERDIVVAERAHQAGRMRALAPRVEMRSLQMQADHAGNGAGRHRVDRRDDALAGVGDQCRQQSGGTGPPVSRRDAAEPVRGGVVVQQYAAAAIDLNVDEAGCEDAAVQTHDVYSRCRCAGFDRDDVLALDEKMVAVAKSSAVEQPRTAKGGQRHGAPSFVGWAST